ncbi:DHA2 family efflux MFS transporter permease subunit [Modestobacter sp. I12A-02628]|uniref:MFS transporter n=1 Tax=Goekera deserti TaxID=2497753 RepID=A0A7K3WK71_9ACTN|nr:MFS transporter [Goekera deserti]MPQ99069.1 DHA2 family efflux MFS transporter permease subunit [Goekera deserti]NDI47403.1 DHA2 family efflux MFS transporter permease subunit [Goekera deserti]NEL55933.1 MFS transporter [Goekera deserti]
MVDQSQLARPSSPGAVLAVLSLAAFMASLDLFIVNVAFDAIGRDLDGASLTSLSWVLNAYAIVYAALLVPLGRLADRWGRKAGFQLGLAVFTLASVACALAPGLWTLVAARVLQAAGAALLTPTSLALLLHAMPVERRVRAVRTWAATGALAAAAGPVVGGLLVSASWRWVFLVNLPIGVLALVVAVRVVPESRESSPGRLPDLAGAALLVAGIGLLSLALVQAPEWGWGSARVWLVLAAALLCAAVFWWRSMRHASPVVEPALLRVRAFAWSNATALVFGVAFAGNLLVNVLWMQQVWGWSALQTGLGVAPGPLMVPVFAAVAQRLSARLSPGVTTALGCLLVAAGLLYATLALGPEVDYLADALPGWLIGGAGVGLALPTILSNATADLPPSRSATGSAVVNMSRQVGTVLGVSVLVALLGTPVGFPAVDDAYDAVRIAMLLAALLAAGTALGMTPRRTPAPVPDPPGVPRVRPDRTGALPSAG